MRDSTNTTMRASRCGMADKLGGRSDGRLAWAAFTGEGIGGAAGWGRDALKRAPRDRPGRGRVNGARRSAATERGTERAELAGGEGVKGAEAGGEFDGGQALVAVEGAEEIARGSLALLRVALDAAGDEVAVGVAAELDTRHDMVQALLRRGKGTQTIKTEATLAGVDGLAKRASLQEVGILEIASGSLGARHAGGAVDANWGARRPEVGGPRAAGTGGLPWQTGANFAGQADLDEMTGFGAVDEAQSAESHESADGFAGRSPGDANGTGEPLNGEAETRLSFEAAVAQKMRIDGAIEHGKAQVRDENVFHLFPELGGVGNFVFHVMSTNGDCGGLGRRAKKKQGKGPWQ